jgi:hypothetical protein
MGHRILKQSAHEPSAKGRNHSQQGVGERKANNVTESVTDQFAFALSTPAAKVRHRDGN